MVFIARAAAPRLPVWVVPTMTKIISILRAARAAGKVITQNVDRYDPMSIEKKQRNDFVTEVDRKAEAEIVNTLRRSYPDHAFLCEESGLIGDENAEFQWIIDPLDGTTNFIHGLPHFAVSIALTQNGKLFQAVVYDPMRQELFTAGKGEGAFLDSKRLRVSPTAQLSNALLSCGFPFRDGQDLDFFQRTSRHYTERSGGVRRMGSAALDLAYVAAGRIDGAWLTGLHSWDMAAGGLIVREAGGLLNDFDGGDDWLNLGEVIAATPKIHHQMLEVMKPLSKARHQMPRKKS